MRTHRLNFLQLLAVCIISFGIVACGGDNTEEGTEVEFNRTENSLIIRTFSDPPTLNGLIETAKQPRVIIEEVQQYLLNVDPGTLEYIPQLAKARPEIINIEEGPYAGGVKLIYEIQETAVWDNGTPVTAEDYLFTFKVVLIPGAASAALQSYYTFVKDVQIDAENPKKFTVFLDKPYYKAEDATGNGFTICPKYFYDPQGLLDEIQITDLTDPDKAVALAKSSDNIKSFIAAFTGPEMTRQIVGSGPYEFVEWVTGQQIVLRKKQNWWGDAVADEFLALRAYPNEIIFKPIPEVQTALSALKSEEIDIMDNIPSNLFLEMQDDEATKAKYNLYVQEDLVYYLIWINNRRPLLADVNVRQALAHSINIDTIIGKTFLGFGSRTISPIAPGTEAFNENLKPTPFDPDKARQLLSAGGWEDTNNDGIVDKEIDGERKELVLEFTHRVNSKIGESMGLIMKNYAAEVGIGIDIVAKAGNVVNESTKTGDYDLSTGGSEIKPVWTPRQRWHSQGDDRTGFGSAYTDSLIERSEIIVDDQERNEIYKELQQILHEKMSVIFLMNPQNRIAIHKRFDPVLTKANPNFVLDLTQMK